MQRNLQIDIWRIVFTYTIATYHLKNAFGHETSLYIGVEFFFILSGLLLASAFERKQSQNITAGKYTLSRIERLFPHCLFSYILIFIAKNISMGTAGIRSWMLNFIEHIPEMLLIWPLGLNKERSWPYSAAPWYLGVLFIVGYVFYWMLINHKQSFTQIIAPISAIVIYAYFYRTQGGLHHAYISDFFISDYILRGWADMSVGVVLYYTFIDKKNTEGKGSEIINWIIPVLAFSLCLLIGNYTSRNEFDFLKLALIIIGIIFCLGFDNKGRNSRIIDAWSILCFPIYMNHSLIRNIFGTLFDTLDIRLYLLYYLVITIYSVITLFIVNKLVAFFSKITER